MQSTITQLVIYKLQERYEPICKPGGRVAQGAHIATVQSIFEHGSTFILPEIGLDTLHATVRSHKQHPAGASLENMVPAKARETVLRELELNFSCDLIHCAKMYVGGLNFDLEIHS